MTTAIALPAEKRHNKAKVLMAAAAVATVAASWAVNDDYVIYLAKLLAINVMVVYGVNLLMGYAGQAFLAIAATFAVGAYTCALLVTSVQLAMPLAWLAGGLLAGLTGLVASVPALRLSGAYLAMVSIAFNVVVEQILVNWASLTAGPVGIVGIPAMTVAGVRFDDHQQLTVMLIAALVTMFAVIRLRQSQWGFAFVAMRDSEIAARSLGLDTARLRANAFFVASTISGLAGGLYSHSILYISPDISAVFESIVFVLMVVLGGMGTAWGPLLGCAVLTLLPQLLSDFQSYHLLVLGCILLASTVLMPRGILPALAAWRRRGAVPSGDRSTATADVDLRLSVRDGAALSLQGVSKSFGGLAALTDVGMEIARGTIHGLIGPNGSGKSTLVNVLSGYYRADSGSGRLDGLDILGLRMTRIARSGLVRTFQTPQLFEDLSVLENLSVAQFPVRRASLFAALFDLPSSRRAGEDARAEALRIAKAVGLEGALGRRAGDLAQGDRRILEIGRALAAQPKLLVLDEPAAGLPSAEIAKLCILLEALRANGLTLVLIEHHMDMIMRVCDRVTVLERGQVIADGSPAQIQEDERVRRAYLGANKKGGRHVVA